MERMKKEKKADQNAVAELTREGLYKENKGLWEENAKLKKDIKKWENKRMLKLAEIYITPVRDVSTAVAKNEWYSSWYDTVKTQMLHELGFYRLDVQDLLKENKKLKADLEECQCSFGFEGDEVGFRKGEYKRLKKWIKDHCKGYGNLFPEDEMKR